jgi:hypothetical protein
VTLSVEQPECVGGLELDEMLDGLVSTRPSEADTQRHLQLSVQLIGSRTAVVPEGVSLFVAEGFRGVENDQDFYLTEGSSALYLPAGSKRAVAYIASSFLAREGQIKHTFWAYAILKLLRTCGFYSLHAAGLIAPAGCGVLIAGPSGCGKSTLTLGMIRRGWSALSDDAVLLCAEPDGVRALALRKYLYIDVTSLQNSDLSNGPEQIDHSGRCRRKLTIEELCPGQQLSESAPADVLIFPRIVHNAQSSMARLDNGSALRHLLLASGAQLFDRRTLAGQFEILKLLLRRAPAYQLRAGLDLYHEPAILEELLEQRS